MNLNQLRDRDPQMTRAYDPLPVLLENIQPGKLDQGKQPLSGGETSRDVRFVYHDFNSVIEAMELSTGVKLLCNGVVKKAKGKGDKKGEPGLNFQKSEYTQKFYNKNLKPFSIEPIFHKSKSFKGKLNGKGGLNETQNLSANREKSVLFRNFGEKQGNDIRMELSPVLNSFFAKNVNNGLERELPVIPLNPKTEKKGIVGKNKNDEFIRSLMQNETGHVSQNTRNGPAVLPKGWKDRKFKR